jgi:hypothetical protein
MDEDLKGIVERMVRAGESENDIALVIKNYVPKTLSSAPPSKFDQIADAAINAHPAGQALAQVAPYVNQVVKTGAKILTSDTPKFLGAVDEAIGRWTGNEYKSPLTSLGEATEKVTNLIPALTPEQEQTLPGQVASGLGSAGAIMATAGLGELGAAQQLAPMASKVPSALGILGKQLLKPTSFVGGAMTATPEYEASLAAGSTKDEAFETLVKNYFVGQTEALPIEAMFGRLNQITGGGIAKNLKAIAQGIGVGGFTEGVQEGVQTYLSNKIAAGDYDPDRDPFWGVADAMTVGGLVGMIIPGVGGAIKSASPEVQAKVQRKMQEIQAKAATIAQVDQSLAETSTGAPAVDQAIDQGAKLTPEQLGVVQENKLAAAVEEGAIEQKEKFDDLNKETEKVVKDAGKVVEKAQTAEEDRVAKIEELRTKLKDSELEGPARDKLIKEIKDLQAEEGTIEGATEGAIEDAATVDEFQKKYDDAVDKVRALQARFAQSQPADDLTQLYQQLMEAQHALRQIAGQPKTPKTPLQKQIEATTGVTKSGEAPINMTPAQILRDHIQTWSTYTKGITKGVKKASELKNELVVKVQEALKGSPLTNKQTSTILTKLRKANLSTPGSISRFNDFVTKVTGNAEYAEKLDNASKLRKKIKNKARAEGLTYKERDALKEFFKVDPDVVDVNQYLTEAQKVHDAFGPVKNRPVLNIADTFNYIRSVDAQMAQHETQKKNDQVERLMNKLGVTFEEAQMLMEDETPLEKQTAAANKKAELREQLMELAEEAKNDLHDAWEDGSLVPEGATKSEQTDIDALKKVDLDLLSADQLKFYVKAVDRVTANGDFGGLGNFSAIVKAQEEFKTLQGKMKNSNILNLTQVEANFDSLPMMMQAITGLPEDAAMFQLYMGMKGINDASVKSLQAEESFVNRIKELEKTLTKVYGKKNNGFSSESIVRQGIYSELIRYGEDQDPVQALAATKQAIEQTIENHRKAGETKEAETIEKLYAPFKGLNAMTIEDVKSVMKKVDPAGAKIIETAIELYAPYADPLATYNERFFNKKTVKSVNYSGPRRWKSKGTEEIEDVHENSLGDINSYISSIAKPKQVASAKEFKNLVRPDAVLDFNKHHNMANGIKRVVFGMEAITPMIQVRENLKRKQDLLDLFGRKDGDDASIKKSEKLFKQLFNPGSPDGKDAGAYFDFERHAAGRAIPSEADRQMNRWLNPLRKLGYTLSLSGLSQIPKQATVLANVMVNLGKDANLLSVREIINNRQAMNDFIAGETVAMRGAQKSTFTLGELTAPSVASETDNKLDQYLQSGFEGWLGIKPLVKTDVGMAKMTYLAFYKQYLQNKGVKYEGLVQETAKKEEKIRQEARAYAKQKTDTLQVVSNPAELGVKLKDQAVFAQLVKAMFIPFGTFSTNAKSRMWADWRAMISGNSEQRRAGVRDLAATATEQLTFQSVSGLMKLYLWGSIGQLVAGAFDLPEETEKDKKQAWDNAVKLWQTNVLIDNLPVVMTAPGEQVFVGLVNAAAKRLAGYDDPKYKGPLYKYKGDTEDPLAVLAETTGVYGIFAERLGKAIEVTDEALTGERRDSRGNLKELTPEQERFSTLVAMLYGLNLAGKMPADVVFALDKVRNKQKPGRRAKRED